MTDCTAEALHFAGLGRKAVVADSRGGRLTTDAGAPPLRELERRLRKEARPVILGHVQRGGVPTAYDRVLATRFGWHAVEAAHKGAFGHMTALHGTRIDTVPLADAVAS